MIVRILGRGQFRLDEKETAHANEIDDRVQAAADAGDETAFADELAQLVAYIQANGNELAPEELIGSDAVVPEPGTTLEEASELLSSEGLIPN